MVDQTNIFEGDESKGPETTGDTQATAFTVPDNVAEFVGEGKKYSDVSKALESIPHAQSHIERLEEELTQTRAKLEASKSVEETLSNFASQKEQDTPTSQPVDLDKISELVDQRLVVQQQQQVQQSNVKHVVDTLSKQFGDKDKAESAFISKAAELGVDVSYLNNLAATSPKAVYALFGSESRPASQEFSKSSVNTEAFKPTNNQQKPIKSVMHGSSTSELLDAWRSSTANIGD